MALTNKISFAKLYESVKEKHLVMSFGRMNPPTIGHAKLVDKLHSVAKEKHADHLLVVSGSHDPKKNPLTAEQKLKHAKRFFPDTNIKTATNDAPTYMHHLANAHKAGYKHVTMVVGSDRVKDFSETIHKYNGHFDEKGNGYHFKSVNVVSAGERDPDAQGAEGMSASKMRAHAIKGEYDKFKSGVPSHVKEHHVRELYKDVRNGLKIHESTIRDLYYRGRLFLVNEMVFDLENNSIGKVVFRGPTYVTIMENSKPIKQWISLVETIDRNS